MSASFTALFQVRFDECAADGTVRASALMRYVIETAFAHSAHEGFPLAWYDHRGLYWLVRRVRLDLARPVGHGASVSVTTEVMGFRRIWAQRRNAMKDAAGTVVGEATMDWIFTDTRGQPTRIVPEMLAAFPGVSDHLEPLHFEFAPMPEGVDPQEFLVPAHFLDPRGHMNSAAYLDVFEDALTAQGFNPQIRPVTYGLEYVQAVQFGERVRRSLWQDARGWEMVMTASSGAVLARDRRMG